MKINLYYSLYKEENKERRAEFEKCFMMNAKAGFTAITIFVENQDRGYILGLVVDATSYQHPETTIYVNVISNRAKFEDFFHESEEGAINGCCNADIFFLPEDVDKLKTIDWTKHANLALCLSRYDIASFHENGDIKVAHHLHRQDSADSWFWKNHCIADGDVVIGFCGADNRIAHEFQKAHYKILNASLDVHSYHLHKSQVCNYRTDEGHVKGEMIVEPPYAFHEPCHLTSLK